MNNIRNFMLAIAIMFTSIFGGCEEETEDRDPPRVRETMDQHDCTDVEDADVVEEDAEEIVDEEAGEDDLPVDDSDDSSEDTEDDSVDDEDVEVEEEDVPDAIPGEDSPEDTEEPTDGEDDSESSEDEDPVPGWQSFLFLSYLIF